MYKLTNLINEAIEKCKQNGSCSSISLFDAQNTTISSEWEEWEVDQGYDIVTVYVYQNGIIAFNFQVEETKILND